MLGRVRVFPAHTGRERMMAQESRLCIGCRRVYVQYVLCLACRAGLVVKELER